jgi:hypothetical protein
MRVRGFDGREYVSEVRKLVIVRERSSPWLVREVAALGSCMELDTARQASGNTVDDLQDQI